MPANAPHALKAGTTPRLVGFPSFPGYGIRGRTLGPASEIRGDATRRGHPQTMQEMAAKPPRHVRFRASENSPTATAPILLVVLLYCASAPREPQKSTLSLQ